MIEDTDSIWQEFDQDAARWEPVLAARYGPVFATAILHEAHAEFAGLIPQIPDLDDAQGWSDPLVESVRCLALYKAMRRRGKTAAETGEVLYEAVLARAGEPPTPIPAAQRLTPEQMMDHRRQRAERSQEQPHGQGYVCEFVAGDGVAFDYGYNFTECASQKFYRAQGSEEFLPFFCALDFAYSQAFGLGLTRTMTLAEGRPMCNPRFKSARR
jgi:hypothetical protein